MQTNQKLIKAYKKLFKDLYKKFPEDPTVGLTAFITHLSLLRDLSTVSSVDNEQMATKRATINAALAEYNAFKANSNETIKMFHLSNFCEFLKLNLEDWLS